MDRILQFTFNQAIDIAIEVLGGVYSGFAHPGCEQHALIYLLGRNQFAIVYPTRRGAMFVPIDYDEHGMKGLQARLGGDEGYLEVGVASP